MNKLKLKKQKTKSKKQSKCNSKLYEEIKQEILGDVKNINKFNLILEEFILSLQNNDEKSIKNLSKIILEIFEYFLVSNRQIVSKDLIEFMNAKLNILLKVQIDALDNISDSENFIILLECLFEFFQYTENQEIKPIAKELMNMLVLKEELVDSNIILNFSKVLTNYEIYYMVMLTNLYEGFLGKVNDEKNEFKQVTLFNIYNFIITLPKFSEEQLKLIYQNIIILLINTSNLPKELLSNLLLNLNKVIFENLQNPLILSDYLINIYEKSTTEQLSNKVLSLSGLFVLITKYKLDYPNYYNLLYQTVNMKYSDLDSVKTVFDTKNRNRLFKILELSLKSSNVPIIVILSFIKKLARICLITSDNNIIILLGIIKNIIKNHPRALILLLRKKKQEKKLENSKIIKQQIKENSCFDWNKLPDLNSHLIKAKEEIDSFVNVENYDPIYLNCYAKYEQFDDNQIDPYKTNANFSGLWELYTLKNHFSFKVRKMISNFEKNFMTLNEFDLNSVSHLKENDLLYNLLEGTTFYSNINLINADYERFNENLNNFI